ncbi:MAG TPA: hypothetical protein VGB77_15340 [Abditibacteriaceae bacterium]|jgi:hypothetical protein
MAESDALTLKTKLNKKWCGGTSPMPNFLLDEIMPTVSDTQWRLLCVIVRQTLGWQEEGTRNQPHKQSHQYKTRKERDWLSHAQLKTRTGRHSAALCQAIEELVQRKLIEVQNEQGQPLMTSQQRRRARSRLFYRLCPQLGQGSEVATTKTETSGSISQSETISSSKEKSNEHLISQSEFHKAKTTKENDTKDLYKNNFLWFSQSEKLSNTKAEAVENVGQVEKVVAVVNQPNPRLSEALDVNSDRELDRDSEGAVRLFIEEYHRLYAHYRPGQTAPPISEMDRNLLQRRIEQHSIETLGKWLPLFFLSRFGYVRRRDYSLESFLNSLHVLQLRKHFPLS